MKKNIIIDGDDILCGFIVPPENRGQIVTHSYACTEEFILQKTLDASDRSETIVAYCRPASGGYFDPWNGTPKLGRRFGPVTIRNE